MSLFSWKSSRDKKAGGPKAQLGSQPGSDGRSFRTHVESLENRLVMVSNIIPGTMIPGATFDTLDPTFQFPPNPEGAVSPTHLVSAVNSSIRWDLRPDATSTTSSFLGLNTVQATFQEFFSGASTGNVTVLSTFGFGAGGADGDFRAATATTTNGRVIYDHLFDRFIVAALDTNKDNQSTIYVAVSATIDPNDGWHMLSIATEFQASTEFFGRDNDGALVNPQQFYTDGVRLGLTRNDIILTTTAILNTSEEDVPDVVYDSIMVAIDKPLFYEGGTTELLLTRPYASDFLVFRDPSPEAVIFDQTFSVSGPYVPGQLMGIITGYYPDNPGRSISYQIIEGNDDEIFGLIPGPTSNTATLVLLNPTLFVEDGPIELTVQANGEDGPTSTITVGFAESLGPQARNSTFFATPPLVAGDQVGRVIAWDPNFQDIAGLEYAITGGNDNDAFEITETGQIIVADPTLLVAGASFTLSVEVTDPTSEQTATALVNINIVAALPTNGAQAFAASFAVGSTLTNGTVVGIVPAYDPENDPLTYQIVGGNTGNAFLVDAAGNIVVNDANAASGEEFELEIEVSSAGGPPVTVTITIFIPNLLPPVIPALPEGNPNEGGILQYNVRPSALNGTDVGFLPAYDPDGGVSRQNGVIVSNLIYSIDYNAGNPFDDFFVIDATTGLISVDKPDELVLPNGGVFVDVAVSDGTFVTTSSIFIHTDAFFPGLVPSQNFGDDGDSAFLIDFAGYNRPLYNIRLNTDLDIRANIFRWDTSPVGIDTLLGNDLLLAQFRQYVPLAPGVLSPGFSDPAVSASAPWITGFGEIPLDPRGGRPIIGIVGDPLDIVGFGVPDADGSVFRFAEEIINGGGQTPGNAVWQPLRSNPLGGIGRLWTANAMVDDTTGLVSVRWYEFEVATQDAEPVFLGAVGAGPLQQGGVNLDKVPNGATLHTYSPGIMVDELNNMALAFAGSSSVQNISAYYTGRFNDDRFNPLWNGTTRPTKVLMAGEDLYARGFSFALWDRTSGIALDPVAGGGFWTFNAYAQTRPLGNLFGSWATTWGQFILVPDRQVFIIDVSQSMNVVQAQNVTGDNDTEVNPQGNFADSQDDINGDGIVGSLIDLALAEILRQWQNGLLAGMSGDPGEVAIVIFGTDAQTIVLNPFETGDARYYVNPLEDLNQNGKSDFIEAILSIREGKSSFIYETTVGTAFTNYAPPIDQFRERTEDFPLEVVQGQMYSDGSGRLPRNYVIDVTVPRIDTYVLGPYQFIGSTVEPSTGEVVFNDSIIADYLRISTETLGLAFRINRPAVNTIDGGYTATVRPPIPEFGGSISEGATVTLPDGTVITIFPDGSITVIPTVPAAANETEDDTTSTGNTVTPPGTLPPNTIVPNSLDAEDTETTDASTTRDRARNTSSSTETMDEDLVDSVFES